MLTINFPQWFRSNSTTAPAYSQLSTASHLHGDDADDSGDDDITQTPPPPPIKTRRRTQLAIIAAVLAILLLSPMLYQYAISQPFPINSPTQNDYLFITASSPFALQKACEKYQPATTTFQVFLTAQRLLDQLQHENTVCGVLSFSVQWDEVFRTISTLHVVAHHETDPWQSIFDQDFSLWTRELFSLSIEEEIDESCLARRKKEMRKSNCDALEIPVIRAAILLTRLLKHQAEIRADVNNLITTNAVALARRQQLMHTALHKQLSTWISVAENVPIPEARKLPVIDAGACIQIGNNTDKTFTGPSAQCLPSFIIIGAQKSGTDELSVYLNRNSLANRRMDGGVELHFFDCVGRGIGNIKDEQDRFRLSCDRLRTGRMNSNNPAGALSSLQAFTWRNVSKTSPFVEELYAHYMQLGQLTMRQYVKEHRTLLFEKSPSYIDMANPRDVVRVLPRAKFVFLSRDPVPRLVSAYFQYCETYDVVRAAQNCTMGEFEVFARALASGELDITTQDDSLPRRQAFYRGALYGMYDKYFKDWLKYFWVDSTMQDKQFLLVDSFHFSMHPRAVLYAVESFVGIRGYRHYDYRPRVRDGRYTYGEASKASHPTHNSTLSADIERILREYYKPSIDAFREMLTRPDCPIIYGLAYEEFPRDMLLAKPHFFNGTSRFALPAWMLDYQSV